MIINLQFQATQEAIQIAEESRDIYSKAISYVNHGISCYGKGLMEKAEKYFQKGAEFCERIEMPTRIGVARFGLGETYFEMGDFMKAKEGYDKHGWVLERNQLNPSNANFGKVGSTKSKVMNKEKDVNLETLYPHPQNNKVKISKALNSLLVLPTEKPADSLTQYLVYNPFSKFLSSIGY